MKVYAVVSVRLGCRYVHPLLYNVAVIASGRALYLYRPHSDGVLRCGALGSHTHLNVLRAVVCAVCSERYTGRHSLLQLHRRRYEPVVLLASGAVYFGSCPAGAPFVSHEPCVAVGVGVGHCPCVELVLIVERSRQRQFSYCSCRGCVRHRAAALSGSVQRGDSVRVSSVRTLYLVCHSSFGCRLGYCHAVVSHHLIFKVVSSEESSVESFVGSCPCHYNRIAVGNGGFHVGRCRRNVRSDKRGRYGEHSFLSVRVTQRHLIYMYACCGVSVSIRRLLARSHILSRAYHLAVTVYRSMRELVQCLAVESSRRAGPCKHATV